MQAVVGKEVTISRAAAVAIDQLKADDHCFPRAKPGAGSSLDYLPGKVNAEYWEDILSAFVS